MSIQIGSGLFTRCQARLTVIWWINHTSWYVQGHGVDMKPIGCDGRIQDVYVCSCCHQEMKQFEKRFRMKRCTNSDCIRTVWDRDLNASINILNLFLELCYSAKEDGTGNRKAAFKRTWIRSVNCLLVVVCSYRQSGGVWLQYTVVRVDCSFYRLLPGFETYYFFLLRYHDHLLPRRNAHWNKVTGPYWSASTSSNDWL